MRKKQAGKRSKTAGGKSKAPAKKRAASVEKSVVVEKEEAVPGVEVSDAPDGGKPIRNIQKHADKEVRKAFPEICNVLIKRAKSGAMGETKLLLRISRLDEKRPAAQKQRGKTLSAMLLAELEKAKKAEPEQPVSESAS